MGEGSITSCPLVVMGEEYITSWSAVGGGGVHHFPPTSKYGIGLSTPVLEFSLWDRNSPCVHTPSGSVSHLGVPYKIIIISREGGEKERAEWGPL